MGKHVKSIDVKAPVRAVYNQWTQFNDFPRFMEGVEEVTQLDDKRLRWVATIDGKRKEWYAEITEQVPDQRIAWCSEEGMINAGVVMFDSLDEENTRVTILMTYAYNVGNAGGVNSHRGQGVLERFKHLIEQHEHNVHTS